MHVVRYRETNKTGNYNIIVLFKMSLLQFPSQPPGVSSIQLLFGLLEMQNNTLSKDINE